MSTHRIFHFGLKLCRLYAVALWLAGFSCAHASLPQIEVISTNSGKPATARLTTHDGKTYLTGVIYRRSNWSNPHVHVVLLDAIGKSIASRSSSLTSWHGNPATHQRGTYSLSFPSSEMGHAATVRITFLGGVHAACADSEEL